MPNEQLGRSVSEIITKAFQENPGYVAIINLFDSKTGGGTSLTFSIQQEEGQFFLQMESLEPHVAEFLLSQFPEGYVQVHPGGIYRFRINPPSQLGSKATE